MKFSFEAENYRKNLAEDLKEKRAEGNREEAKEILEKEREEFRYHVARDIKKVLKKLEGGEEEEREEDTSEQESGTEHEYGKEIWTETLEMEGSDGEKHTLEVTVLDVSEDMPEEVKLLHDIYRLAVLDTKLKDLGVGPDNPYFKDERTDMEGNLGAVTIREYKWLAHIYHESFPNKQDVEEVTYEETLDKIIRAAFSKQEAFINTITNGSLDDKRVFEHIVGGGGGESGYQVDMKHSRKDDYTKLMNRFIHPQEGTPKENIFDIKDESTKSKELWFSPKGNDENKGKIGGGPVMRSLDRMILLCNTENGRFKKEIESVSGGSYGTRSAQEYNNALEQIQTDPEKRTVEDELSAVSQGSQAYIEFKKEEPWVYIADWIADLYHGRVYKISEVDSKEGSNEDE